MARVLLTGGCGFIGRHVWRQLLEAGHEVKVIDALEPQVHNHDSNQDIDNWIPAKDSFIAAGVGDHTYIHNYIRNFNPEFVLHLAAAVGVGQSMYAIADYVKKNTYDTALFLETLDKSAPKLRRLVVASSMSCYGEGRYTVHGEPASTPETKPFECESIYAITKRDQEELCLVWGKSRGIPTTALRLFNTYGPEQSLSNPYTGAAAIFASRCLNGKPPIVFEDGLQSRDFVYVEDVARAFVRTVDTKPNFSGAINIGTGRQLPLIAMAKLIAEKLEAPEPIITGQFRKGDIRHCFADVSKAKRVLGWKAQVSFEEGINKYIDWMAEQPRDAVDKVSEHIDDMVKRGLIE